VSIFSVRLERLLVYHASVSYTNVRQAIVLGMHGSKALKAPDQCIDSGYWKHGVKCEFY